MIGHLTPTDLFNCASYLAGDFHNQEQALENPPFFAQIQVCYRPLPWSVFQGIGFYVEQAYIGHLEDPYRTAVVELVLTGETITIRNYRPNQVERWKGGGREQASRLDSMQKDDLTYLPDCDLVLYKDGEDFRGESQPGARCWVQRQGRKTYLTSRVYLSAQEFQSHDRGYDPDTHEQVWGALAGPFRFTKIQNWMEFLPSSGSP